jgi:hypothetical protein
MRWWAYLPGVVWLVSLTATVHSEVFSGAPFTMVSLLPEAVLTVLWGAVLGVHRAWPQLCLAVLAAGAVWAVSTAVFLGQVGIALGPHLTERTVALLYVLLIPMPFGVLCTALAASTGLGMLVARTRRGSGSEPAGDGVVPRQRLAWLTVAGSLWAVLVAVGTWLEVDSRDPSWITDASSSSMIVVVAIVSVVWGGVIGALREWAEVPMALGLAAVAVIVATALGGAVGPGLFGGTFANTAATMATVFGLVILALSLGAVAAGSVSSLTHATRRRHPGPGGDGTPQVEAA